MAARTRKGCRQLIKTPAQLSKSIDWQLIMILPAIFVFLYAITKAASSAITYDEAYTYIYYATNFSFSTVPDLFVNSLPNNHWLNTFLIFVAQELTGATYNEFVIRLPSIAAYSAYLLLCYMMWKNRIIPLWCYGLMLFCPILNEFFGLARGYGLAVLFITLAMHFYSKWHASNFAKYGYLSVSFLSLIVAGFSITYSVLWLVAFGLVTLRILLINKNHLQNYLKSQWLAVVAVVIGSVIILAYQYFSTHGKPIPPGTTNFLVFVRDLSLTIIPNVTVATIVTTIVFSLLIFSLFVFRKRILKSVFVLPFVVCMIMLLCLSNVGFSLPISRGILIFYIPLLLAISEITKWWYEDKKVYARKFSHILSGSVFGLSAVMFVAYSSPVVFSEWGESNGVRDLAYSATADPESRKEIIEIDDAKTNSWTPLIPFYRQQISQNYHIDILERDL